MPAPPGAIGGAGSAGGDALPPAEMGGSALAGSGALVVSASISAKGQRAG
ncbi:MAG: hypothetical protein FJ096_09965 [Deltaproteobacteria bacterium]|nr:hypothetical protein [Deltaproteobacteria bacterium]